MRVEIVFYIHLYTPAMSGLAYVFYMFAKCNSGSSQHDYIKTVFFVKTMMRYLEGPKLRGQGIKGG